MQKARSHPALTYGHLILSIISLIWLLKPNYYNSYSILMSLSECWAPTACKHTVSGSISLPSPGCFSPFPHGTFPLSVSGEYLALGGGPPRFTQDSSCPVLLGYLLGASLCFAYRTITLYGATFQMLRLQFNVTFNVSPTTPRTYLWTSASLL